MSAPHHLINTMRRWREAYNPMRGLTLERCVRHLEEYQQGIMANVQWLFDHIEGQDATLLTVIENLDSAIGEIDWDIAQVSPDSRRFDPILAAEQEACLRSAYENIENLSEAISHLVMARFRGFAHLAPWCRLEGRLDTLYRLHPLHQWNMVRQGLSGPWAYNPSADPIDYAQTRPDYRLTPNDALVRERPRYVNRLALIKYIRATTAEKDWDAYVEIYGIPACYIVLPQTIPTDSEGRFIGEIVKTGKVFDNNCRLLGTADNNGIVKDRSNRYVGCVNPDGSVLDEKGNLVGSVMKSGAAVDFDGMYIGKVNENNLIVNDAKLPVGCVGIWGDVFNNQGAYIGHLVGDKYGFDLDGNYLNPVDDNAEVKIYGKPSARLTANNLLINAANQIVGVAIDSKSVVLDGTGKPLGILFPDGNVYNDKGVVQGKIKGDGLSFYNNQIGALSRRGEVINTQGEIIGVADYDGAVISRYGDNLGHLTAKGAYIDRKGNYQGAVLRRGAAIGYDGSYIGYATSNGKVINIDGKLSGSVTHDGKVLDITNTVVGEVIPENIMIDIWGNYKGLLNSLGDVIDLKGDTVTAILPGGATDLNLSLLRRGAVIDYAGNLIGAVMPNGNVINSSNIVVGRVLSDGNVISIAGKLIGEVIEGDIVLDNADKVVGYVNFDGTIRGFDGSILGRTLSSGLAIDANDNIIGNIYRIGATILGNDGQYRGRLAPDGSVIDAGGANIGHIKSNGSFVDLDKKVAGYVLQEVAKNRRN